LEHFKKKTKKTYHESKATPCQREDGG